MKHCQFAIILAFQILGYVSSGENSSSIFNFQAVNITEVNFTMIWDAVPGLSYNIAVRLQPEPTSTPGLPIYITDVISPYSVLSTTSGSMIEPSTIYDSYLIATDVSDPSQQSQASCLGITTVPFPPSSVVVAYAGASGAKDADWTTQLYLEWSRPTAGGDAIKDYLIECFPSSDIATKQSARLPHQNGIDSYNYTMKGLTPGVTYDASFTALSSSGRSGRASPGYLITIGPPTPTNATLTRDPLLSDRLNATWTMPSYPFLISLYSLAFNGDSIGSGHFDYYANESSPTTYVVRLPPGGSYIFAVTAVISSPTATDYPQIGYQSRSSKSVKIEDNRPTNVTSTITTTNSASIEWGYPTEEPSYPVQGYLIEWSTLNNTNSTEVTNSTNAATLLQLISNTYYNITVQVRTEVGDGIPSESIMIATDIGPAADIALSHSVRDPTTMLRINWNQPNGGDAIPYTYYVVNWWATNNLMVTNSTFVPHIEGTVSYNYTFDDFIPGESYTMTVNVSSANDFNPGSEVTLPTVPSPVANLILIQNETNPTTSLDLSWSSPLGVNDKIEIIYYSLFKENATYIEIDPIVSNISLNVQPGTNYTVVVSVYSYNISSAEETQEKNSKSSEPVYKVILSRNWLELTWNPPSGHVEGFFIQSDPVGEFQDISIDSSINSHIIEGLNPDTNYTIRMYSWITNIDGSIELSTSTPTTYKTLPTFCPKSVIAYPVFGVDQNATFADTVAGYSNSSSERCSGNTTNKEIPFGTRVCSITGKWKTPIFLTSCASGIQELATEGIVTNEQRTHVASELVVLTSNPESLDSTDIQDAADVLDIVVETDSLEPNAAALAVEAVGNLLAVPAEELAASGTSGRLLSILDEIALKVNLSEGEQFQSTTSTLAVYAVKLLQEESHNGVGFTVSQNLLSSELGFRSDQFEVIYNRDRVNAPSSYIYLPGEVLSKSKDGKISFYCFINDNIFAATSPLQVTPDLSASAITHSFVNSQVVLAATVVTPARSLENLSNAIEIHLELDKNATSFFEVEKTAESALCAFWDETNAYWSTKGCVTIATNTSAQCHCDHLTNFASLFAYGDSTAVIREDNNLDILTYVGSAVSLLAICCTIFSLLCVWNSTKLSMQKPTKFAMLNLSISLLLLNLFLIVSELYDVTSSDTSCLAVAIIIHFSLFSSLAWMMVEAVYLFIGITEPIYFRTKLPVKRFFLFSSLWGWGFPALYIALVAAIKTEWYRNDDQICWIDSDMIVYLVIIPASVILFCNLTCYIAVMMIFLKHRKPGEKSLENQRKRDIMFSLTLFVTFGITWIFGFMLFGSSLISIVFAYIFTILNALQGVLLFILFVYRNKNLRTIIGQEMNLRSKHFVNESTQGNTTHATRSLRTDTKIGKCTVSASVST